MKKITVYSQNSCASCVMVKKWLTMKNVTFTEVNLDDDPSKREYVQQISGSSTVPVIVTEDDVNDHTTISIGYKPAQLASLISA